MSLLVFDISIVDFEKVTPWCRLCDIKNRDVEYFAHLNQNLVSGVQLFTDINSFGSVMVSDC